MTECELTKIRFDYAWKHFDFHAKQRVTMFNFFLIVVGILANAIVAAIENNLPFAFFTMCLTGVLMALAFLCLDVRNTDLLENGEDILRKLEEDELFTGYKGVTKGSPETSVQLGMLYREWIEKKERKSKMKDQRYRRPNRVKHKYWIRLVEGAVGVVFLIAAIFSFGWREIIVPPVTPCQICVPSCQTTDGDPTISCE